MGALTHKSFPFEIRGWDLVKFDSLDPTDGFGSNTKIYINKNQIILIEPDYSINTSSTWLTDKSRQFFDGIFNYQNFPSKNFVEASVNDDFWLNLFKTLIAHTYVINQCNNQRKNNKKHITFVFENLSLEVLSLLLIISQNYSFIKLKRFENFKIENDHETKFQLNKSSDKIKLNSSTLGLLISNNPRYEGYQLNLKLRQRFLKGNFDCLSLGSIIDLSFPVSFLGSNFSLLTYIAEGNCFYCLSFKFAKTPIIIYNNELFKRNDKSSILQVLKLLNNSSSFKSPYNGLNMLSPSLSENGNHFLLKIPCLGMKDLIATSILYFINISTNNTTNLKKITDLNLFNCFSYEPEKKSIKLMFDQNYITANNFNFFSKLVADKIYYSHLPTSVFYENEETFINTEGFFKRTVKIISRKKIKNNWQILRKFLKTLKKKFLPFNKKNKETIFFNLNNYITFKNFMNFNFYAVRSLTNLNFYLTVSTNPAYIYKKSKTFKSSSLKTQNTKLKYWLDDFFTCGKDEYSQNSYILTNSSKILRNEYNNFF